VRGAENIMMFGIEKLSKKRRRWMAIFWGGEISI